MSEAYARGRGKQSRAHRGPDEQPNARAHCVDPGNLGTDGFPIHTCSHTVGDTGTGTGADVP